MNRINGMGDHDWTRELFVDAQWLFRRMRKLGQLPMDATLGDLAAKVNLLAHEAEENGLLPRELLPRLPENATPEEAAAALGKMRAVFFRLSRPGASMSEVAGDALR
jgi:hypothetical protein